MITTIISLILLVVLVGILFFFWRRKKLTLFDSICIFIYGFLILGASHCTIFMGDIWGFVFFIPCVFLIIWFHTWELKEEERRLVYVITIFTTLILMIPTGIINLILVDNHVIMYDYRVSIEDDEIKVSFDTENIARDYCWDEIEEKIEEMKDFNVAYYEGTIAVKFKCNVPRYIRNKCTCTEHKICNLCRKYLYNPEIIE